MWTQVYQKRSNPRGRLFCFPFAGGDAVAYRDWGRFMDKSLEVRAIQIPGRGNRMLEPPIRQVKTLVHNITDEIQEYLDLPYWFFGHSFGSVLAFETVRCLQGRSLPPPCRLIVSASEPPQNSHLPRDMVHLWEDRRLKAKIKSLGGVPEEILEHEDFLDFYLKIIRADLEALETYRYQGGEPLSCPISLFYSEQDPMIPAGRVDGWEEHSAKGFHSKKFPGGHFFFNEALEDFLKELGKELN